MTVLETGPETAHPLSRHVPERHVPPGSAEFYADVLERLRAWEPLPVSEIRRTLNRVLESPVPEHEVAYLSWRLRSWHQRLSTIATADGRYPPNARDVLLIRAGKVIGDEQGGDSSVALDRLRQLAKITSELLARVATAHRLRDPADEA
ncbi:DUF6415 family natural product biosynthesis protein [Streptomyces bacillaris]|uniref:DUF6415 family natural product biosynthesis protein n=1 Tax=Streptomyces bacillaris TaxID=68179 RepID=UPI00067AF0B0